ncbi:MAG: deoxyribose-phosphate aldolase [Bacteroidales bacterium]|nr:deoxyribose-phosphate aldolase [Bacteroidales bacterium]
MELVNHFLEAYGPGEEDYTVQRQTRDFLSKAGRQPLSTGILKKLMGLIDLTSLHTDDHLAKARELARLVNQMPSRFSGIPLVAGICVYPPLIEELGKELKQKEVALVAVGGSFPTSQTFLSIKLAECELLVKKGAEEIDVVLPVGAFLAGEHQKVLDELLLIREVTKTVKLKVILETGLLQTAHQIRHASFIAMEAGADFIKTSTGKEKPAATPDAVYIMARAIRDFYSATGKMTGIKPAGGISTPEEVAIYYHLVEQILGEKWLNASFFRIGASRLANHILNALEPTAGSYF